ncbi:MAG: hypothetical protein QW035_00915 [Candidatus Anstonellales archaeon]
MELKEEHSLPKRCKEGGEPLLDGQKNVKWKKEKGLLTFEFSTSDLFVMLALREEQKTKYIIGDAIVDGNKTKVILALPLEFHKDIVETFEKYSNTALENIRGGFIEVRKSGDEVRVKLFGESMRYGKADHIAVGSLLRRIGIDCFFDI